jgi:hypothetical protein
MILSIVAGGASVVTRINVIEQQMEQLINRPAAPIDSISRMARIESGLESIGKRLDSIERKLENNSPR